MNPTPATSDPLRVEHPTIAERAATGKAARRQVPRSSHAGWDPPADRVNPLELLEEQARSRVADLVPIRYGRMLVSPFTFYRGAAYLMASDLASTPHSGLTVQLCGDAHLSNFGVFAAPDRRLVFSLNDFDETHPGPFEWDVKRLAASFEVAGRDNGFTPESRREINLAIGRAYREAMGEFATKGMLDMWYTRLDEDDVRTRWGDGASDKQRKAFEKNVSKARAKDSMRALSKLVEVVDGVPRLKSDPPLIVTVEDLFPDQEAQAIEDWVRDALRSYRASLRDDHRKLLERFRYSGMARKVVGVGSVGTRAWIVLLFGQDDHDPLFLQCKEAQTSVLEPFLGRSEYDSHGQRVVEGQRLMQSASDILLGWVGTVGGDGVARDYYVRQLWDGKGSAVIEAMKPSGLLRYAKMCGWTLARGHARSGDAAAIASYLGNSDVFDQSMASFAEAYADQNERDYAALKQAVDAGRITAQFGL